MLLKLNSTKAPKISNSTKVHKTSNSTKAPKTLHSTNFPKTLIANKALKKCLKMSQIDCTTLCNNETYSDLNKDYDTN